ncbi:TIGR03086 family metal-binding protein [Streptosporangium sp. NPDC048047]|uniref:TIGR03086 family metal-binding protein n=1 Tax=Streptosporangium sp. NPDC048047 TaxID=3155748 RepID=UPI003415249F
MQLHSLVRQAASRTADVVRGVAPGHLSAPTPCRDWDVRALAGHLLQVVHALGLAGRGQVVPGELWGRDLMSGEWTERFGDEAAAAITAWGDPAAWEGTIDFGGMEMPAPLTATMLTSDLVIHGWDLARATGQDYRCAGDVAESAYRFIVDMGEQGRQMGIYASPLPVKDEAPALDRALALSGRDPYWSPPVDHALRTG